MAKDNKGKGKGKETTNVNALVVKDIVKDKGLGKGKDKNKKAGLNGLPSKKDLADKVAGKPGVGTTHGGKPITDAKDKGSNQGKKDSGKQYSDDPVLRFQQKEAERARQDEKDRQDRIKKGKGLIDEQFAKFDPAYYAKRETEFRNTYQPQIDEDFKKAQEAMKYALARAGIGTSTAAVDRQNEIVTNRDRNNAMLSTKVAADRTATQKLISDERSALISQLNQDAKANEIGNEATAKTTNLFNATPDYQGFGDIFYGAAQGVAGVGQAVQNAQYANTFNGSAGSGSFSPRSTGVRNSTNIY